ncbi:unnamed protein product [Cuscuta campestris]|uniref:Uncharacterized protein n=1 Tax=Cuscuta campestris TaxID=132261 RepID=A0A484K5D5_9ASTE|nr:unnamed protein product [Cuscuta campestris]
MAMNCETRSLSSLELLLAKLQQSSDEQYDDGPPALPPRPVVRARRPRTPKRPRPFHLQGNYTGCRDLDDGEIDDLFGSRGIAEGDLLDSDLPEKISDNEKEVEIQKGVEIIQRCYHGHQARLYYHELKRAAIALQSFVRGENARKDYQQAVTRKEEDDKRLEKLRAIICLQSGIRGWLTRRQFEKEMTSHMNSRHTTSHGSKDEDTKMLVDLRRRLQISETALARANDENASLKRYISDCDKRLEEYESKMQSLEKTWQDQVTTLKTSLAAIKRSQIVADNGSPRIATSSVAHYDGELLANVGTTDGPSQENVGAGKGDPQKLKLRFKAWNKEYKTRLQGVKSALKHLRYGCCSGGGGRRRA